MTSRLAGSRLKLRDSLRDDHNLGVGDHRLRLYLIGQCSFHMPMPSARRSMLLPVVLRGMQLRPLQLAHQRPGKVSDRRMMNLASQRYLGGVR